MGFQRAKASVEVVVAEVVVVAEEVVDVLEVVHFCYFFILLNCQEHP